MPALLLLLWLLLRASAAAGMLAAAMPLRWWCGWWELAPGSLAVAVICAAGRRHREHGRPARLCGALHGVSYAGLASGEAVTVRLWLHWLAGWPALYIADKVYL